MSVQTILAAGFLFLGGLILQTVLDPELGFILAFIGAITLIIHLIWAFVRRCVQAVRWFNEKYPLQEDHGPDASN